jgi:hypothetical protein
VFVLALSHTGPTGRRPLATMIVVPVPTRWLRRPVFTATPDVPAPPLWCPECGAPLVYLQSVFNGVVPIERWDFFECASCGPFEYRQRTRKLRASRHLAGR